MGVNTVFWKTPDTALYSTYVSTFELCTFQLGEDAVRLKGLEVEDLHVWEPEVLQDVQVDGCKARRLRSMLRHSLVKGTVCSEMDVLTFLSQLRCRIWMLILV